MNRKHTTMAVGGAVALALSGWLLLPNRPVRPAGPSLTARVPVRRSAEAAKTESRFLELDRARASEAPSRLIPRFEAFVASNRRSADPDVQDQVGMARIRLGYLAAQEREFGKARSYFLTAAREYKGPARTHATFGSVPDQAAYQAAVCLVAEKRTVEAEAAFVAFLKERPYSALTSACFKRLVMLNGGKPKPEHERLIQRCVTAQEDRIRQEQASCGPKAIAHLLQTLGMPKRSYSELAKACRTDVHGTTMAHMREVLAESGIAATGLLANRRDFGALRLPALWLMDQHYVVLLELAPDSARVYDPLHGQERVEALPDPDDERFSAFVLALELPNRQEATK